MILTNPQAVETAQARERVLVASRSGRWLAVAELGTAVPTGELEVFTVSGYFRSRDRAYKRRARLAREGLWLAESSRERMRRGDVLRVGDLRWEP